jgi:acyl-CoA synthetase (AMP-forming)/AMP-acid ligase II
MKENFQTVVELARARAQQTPDKTAFVFVEASGAEGARLSFADIDARARAVGARLQGMTASAGERVLLLFPPGLDFVTAFLGCLYAGAIPVPAYPVQTPKDLPKLQAISGSAQPTVVLGSGFLVAMTRQVASDFEALQNVQWLSYEDIELANGQTWKKPQIDSDTIAFLQYTSGSTGRPRGVMVTHGNVLHNERMVHDAFGHDPETTVFAGWLPLYHDMGLIGNVLQPFYLGVQCVLMSPLDFLKRPALWLETISKYRATTSGGPNFGFDLCARRIPPEERDKLDLSSWSVAFNGAEPIQPDVLERFVTHFAPSGFRREAFYPCYGLAEGTLFVAGDAPTATPTYLSVDRAELEAGTVKKSDAPNARALVGCGRVWLDQKLAIVDPESMEECPPGRVGEIWVSGGSVAKGYWQCAEENVGKFQARLPGQSDGYLRTGDLGFVHEGQLYVTGRLKDLIIVRGSKHYAEDIERTVERSCSALRAGCGAAFAIDVDGTERAVVVFEVARPAIAGLDRATALNNIREAVTANHRLQLHDVVLLQPGTTPKTSSGKIQRHACRAKYLEHSFDALPPQADGTT